MYIIIKILYIFFILFTVLLLFWYILWLSFLKDINFFNEIFKSNKNKHIVLNRKWGYKKNLNKFK